MSLITESHGATKVKYATVFRTVRVIEEIEFAVEGDFPEDFWKMSKEDQFCWLDENSVNQTIYGEQYDSIESIDTVFFDE